MCHWLRHWNQVSFQGDTDSDPAHQRATGSMTNSDLALMTIAR